MGDSTVDYVIPNEVQDIIKQTKYFIVENIKTARRYLKKVDRTINIDDLSFFTLNKHTSPEEISSFLTPAQEGNNMGIISEAGCPGIADPGSDVVQLCHQKNIRVVPLVGPSSILMALISSGMNGQNFCFNGYLPIDKNERIKKLRELEKKGNQGFTQIFMETPFRNSKLLDDILNNCNNSSNLCIAIDISLPTEKIKTQSIGLWKKNIPDFHKKPTIFLFG